jgi:hypothetical protein
VREVLDVALVIVKAVRARIAPIEARDADIAKLLRIAAAKLPLQLAEAAPLDGRARAHAMRIARGTALDVEAALRLALQHDLISPIEMLPLLDDLAELRRTLWRESRYWPGQPPPVGGYPPPAGG